MLADAVHVSFFYAVRNVPMAKIPHLMTTGTTAFTVIVMAASIYTGWTCPAAAAYCRLRPRAADSVA